MTPHTHAALIHAWADGATIQYKPGGCLGKWLDIDHPTWVDCIDYRIKPNIIRYKRYLMQSSDRNFSVRCIHDWQPNITNTHYFIKWIDTEWQEVAA